MGNRLGSQKQKDQRSKDEKKREKDLKKEKEKLQKKEKKERKKKQHASGLDADLDDSSHVTGGDSESCVFHSAENISASPYLDACTRSELEQGSSWSGMYESFTSASQHPQVLSAKDFKDGFSLEACLPPEIARQEQCDDGSSSATSRLEGRSSSSVRSRKSNNSVKSSSAQPRSLHDTPTSLRAQHAADDVGSIGTSSQISGGYHTPLLSTPVFGRADAPTSPASVAANSTLSKVSEIDHNDCMDIIPTPSAVHHPHFYNHQKLKLTTPQKNESSDFRNLPKPTSPHPQRRALSPKMTSSPIKLISSDDSSSSHTTPTPQRRANILDLFRTSSKKGKTKETKSVTKQGEESWNTRGDKSSNNELEKDKSRPLWKTWERSKTKNSDKTNKTSIFGTARKSDKKKPDRNTASEKDSQIESNYTKKKDIVKGEVESSNGNSPSSKSQKSDNSRASSGRSTSSNYEGRDNSKEDSGLRSSSSPIARSAAFCIMKLEQLERSIEETIREKFPDAEPFLLKKRSKEDETRGSRSLPSTPSLKKKLYVARDANDSKRNSQKGSNESTEANGKTRYCDETFEVCPSPAMSPVILRRFGARTRHASISPKIPRAKTAVLYNSPSEISTIEKSVSTKTVTKVPVYHAVSSYPHKTPANSSSQFMKPLKSSQKSESKYDNVMEDSEISQIASSQTDAPFYAGRSNSEGDDEENSFDQFSVNDDNNVIVPTFSAVFGSVSPKLKRHLQLKLEENKQSEAQKAGLTAGKIRCNENERSENLKPTDINTVSHKSTYVSKTCVQVPSHSAQDSSIQAPNKSVEVVHQPSKVKLIGNKNEMFSSSASSFATVTADSIDNGVPSNVDRKVVSVRQRVTSFNKTMSEGQSSNEANLISGSNSPGASASTREQVTAAPHYRELVQVPGVPQAQRKLQTRAEAGPRVQQQASRVDTKTGETEKSTVLISPGAQRKHSTDHVVFGSAVALPCRLYSNAPLSPTSKCLEETGNVVIPSTEVSRENIAGQSQNVKYVTKQQISLCEADKTEQKVSYCLPIDRDSSNTSVSTHTAKPIILSVLSSNISAVKDIKPHWDTSNVSSDSNSHAPVKLDDNNSIDSSESRDSVVTIRDTQKRVLNDYEPSFREDEQRFVVLKNPVSKVISEMINSSKQEEQKEKQRLEQRQVRQLHQSSPGYGIKHVQEAIATVRSPAYEQVCLTLEEKTVRSDSSVSLPSSPTNNKRIERDFSISDPEVKESRSQEIQTDSITTADKGVDSNSLTRSAEFKRSTQLSKGIPMVREVGQRNVSEGLGISTTASKPTEDIDLSSSDEIELLKDVLSSKKSALQKKNISKADEDSEQALHPPSPNAMQMLIEEFEEEEENAEAMEKKEIEMALMRESEIKEFTDKIYNRLSSLLGSQEEMEDNVFEDDVKETPKARGVDELLSKLETKRKSPYTSSSSEGDMAMFISSSSKIPSSEVGQSKIFTLESSSSLTTTTSSESDPYEEPPLFQPPAEMIDDFSADDAHDSGERYERETEHRVFVFPEIENANENGATAEVQMRRSSREYHSDDDVATGKGIPDYYDDRPLWTRRQKTPSQLSAAMMAIRRRERRERWLKKRRRNKTDLLSTGSSDTGSELAFNDRTDVQQQNNDTSYYNYDDDDDEFAQNEKMIQRQEMGSGMLTSPKYSKPILPFGNTTATPRTDHKKSAPKMTTDRSNYRGERSKSLSGEDASFSNTLVSSKIDTRNYDVDANSDDSSSEEDEQNTSLAAVDNGQGFSPGSSLAIPGIEETFNELMSVKHILEGIQNRTPANETSSGVKCMPLTTENVKSIREYYKDCYSSGRRSRMSAADRTESDLDLYSESRDDESTDSNFNADDEEDEDNLEPYATADDEHAATGGSGSAGLSGSHRDSRRGLGDDDDSETNVVVSCTFYNSNAFPAAAVVDGPSSFKTSPTPVAKSSVMSTPKTLTPTAQASVLNSDDEFWAGSAACEERYRQVVTAADAVSSTFQNARDQMHEIQHHLQALRRQMEVLQDDLSTTSTSKNQEKT